MGLVYRAYDTVVRREVAVKTILDIPDPASLQLFYKVGWLMEASTSHSLGRFGFYIPGNDQVALSSFGHYVDLNTR
jgi:hypothetical protein